jgi:urea carboxylase
VRSYGFLSENVEFASAIEGAGIAFLGPTTATMEQFSLKHTARAIAQNAKVSVRHHMKCLTESFMCTHLWEDGCLHCAL